jgi:hypothetical protein
VRRWSVVVDRFVSLVAATLTLTLTQFCGARSQLDIPGVADAMSERADSQCAPPSSGVLATSQTFPVALSVVAGYVYWLDLGLGGCGSGCDNATGRLMRCSVCGCDDHPDVLADNLTFSTSPPYRTQIGVDGTSAFFKLLVGDGGVPPVSGHGPTSASIGLCPVTGCVGPPAEVVATGYAPQFAVDELLVDQSSIYWIQQGAIEKAAHDGSNPRTLWSGLPLAARGLMLDGATLYWSAQATTPSSECPGGCIMRCDVGACAPNVLVTHVEAISELAQTSDTIFWIDAATSSSIVVGSCPKSGCSSDYATLTSSWTYLHDLVSDGTSLYWAGGPNPTSGLYLDASEQIFACATSDCGATLHTLISEPLGAVSVAVDSNNVYWSTVGTVSDAGPTNGLIRVLPK